jgi:hypothetical protein
LKLIETEGIKYIGSKERLLPYILDFVRRLRPRVVLDAVGEWVGKGNAGDKEFLFLLRM